MSGETPEIKNTSAPPDIANLQAELDGLLQHRFYQPFLNYYVATQPKAAAQMKAALEGKSAEAPEVVAAVEQVQEAMDTILNQVKDRTSELLANHQRYYAKAPDFLDQFAKTRLGNLVDLYAELQAPAPDPSRLAAALTVCDEQFELWFNRQPVELLSNFIDEPAMPNEFWQEYSKNNPIDLKAYARSLFNGNPNDALKSTIETAALAFLAREIKKNYADLPADQKAAGEAIVDEQVKNRDLAGLQQAYEAIYVPFEPAPVTAAEVAAPATVVSGAKTAVESLATLDVRKDAQEHPEKYMDGNKDRFTFKAAKGSAADRLIRIEDLYSTDSDRALTLVSSRFNAKAFGFDASRGSFYEKIDHGFGQQRLVIHGGDVIVSIEESVPAPTEAPAPTVVPAVGETAPALEVNTAEATKKAVGLANTIHALRGTVEARVRALDAAGASRESDPKAWKDVDDTYAAIARLYADPDFDMSRLPKDTEEDQRLLAELTVLQSQMESRVAALGAPENIQSGVATAMNILKRQSAEATTAVADEGEKMASPDHSEG